MAGSLGSVEVLVNNAGVGSSSDPKPLVEVGDAQAWTSDELNAAINDNTAAVAYLLAPRVSRRGPSLRETVEVAHARGVPVIVDAAAMLPPKSNLGRYIADVADLVTVSGGKDIRGP